MKKKILAGLISGICAMSAFAQDPSGAQALEARIAKLEAQTKTGGKANSFLSDSAEIYGFLGLRYTSIKGYYTSQVDAPVTMKRYTGLDSFSPSNLGFRGYKDLSKVRPGMRAIWQVEMGIYIDNPSDPSNTLSGRLAGREGWIGFRDPVFGEIKVGRGKSPMQKRVELNGAIQGVAANDNQDGGAFLRIDNAIHYATPKFASLPGLSADVMYGLAESSNEGYRFSAAANYETPQWMFYGGITKGNKLPGVAAVAAATDTGNVKGYVAGVSYHTINAGGSHIWGVPPKGDVMLGASVQKVERQQNVRVNTLNRTSWNLTARYQALENLNFRAGYGKWNAAKYTGGFATNTQATYNNGQGNLFTGAQEALDNGQRGIGFGVTYYIDKATVIVAETNYMKDTKQAYNYVGVGFAF